MFPRKRKESSSPSPNRARRSSSPNSRSELRARRPASKEQGLQNSSDEALSASRRKEGAAQGAELPSVNLGLLGNSFPLKFMAKLASVLLLVAIVRLGLDSLSHAMGFGNALAPAALTALITSSFMALWRAAEKEVSTQSMLDTSKRGWEPGAVGVCLGNAWLQRFMPNLTLEEAFGLATTLAQLAPVFLFENWGLHGPPKYRWVAVVAHAVAAIVVTIMTQHQLQPLFGVEGVEDSSTPAQVSEVWLGLTAGNWAASSWAASSWWRVAATQARLPALALASTQMANFWLAQRTRQPHLLAACVAFGGLSMACCCGSSKNVVLDDTTSNASVLLTPAIFIGFCAISAWLLFAELLSI